MKIPIRNLRAQHGGAVVEFAIVSTILVPVLMYSMYFVDLAKVRIKTAEVARYAAWEMTSFPLSDYEGTNHDSFFSTAASQVTDDIMERYADDLRSDSPPQPSQTNKVTTGEFELLEAEIKIENQEVDLIPPLENSFGEDGGSSFVSQILGGINGGINWVLGAWKLNTKGQVRAEVSIHFKNKFIGKSFMEGDGGFFSVEHAPDFLKDLKLTDHVVLIADAWTLYDGQDVYPYGNYSPGGNAVNGSTGALLARQVHRVVWAGVNNIPFLGDILSLLSKINNLPIIGDLIDANPLQTRVTSLAARGTNPCKAGNIDVNVDCGQHEFPTTPTDDSGPQCNGFGACKSEYGKSWAKRGKYYMGCPSAEGQYPDCLSGGCNCN